MLSLQQKFVAKSVFIFYNKFIMKAREISDRLIDLRQEIESITEPDAARIISELLNIIENLAADNEKLRCDSQSLDDELSRLRGEQGKPGIKPGKPADGDDTDFSCDNERKKAESAGDTGEKEGFKLDEPSLEKLKEQEIPAEILDSLYKLRRKKYAGKAEFLSALEAAIGAKAAAQYGSLLVKHARYKKRNRKPKVPNILIDRTEKCVVDAEELPDDAEYKGCSEKVVQDIIIRSDNVLFEREVYWSPSERKTYMGEVPVGYEGEFGPHINSQIISFKYVCNMSVPKIREFYADLDVQISDSYISNRLTKHLDVFHEEKSELYEASLEVGRFQQTDDTGSRVNGQNCYTHIVCNDLCTVFFTTPKKDRLTILDILRNFGSRTFVFSEETFDLLKQLRVSQTLICKLRDLTEPDKELNEKDMEDILAGLFPQPDKGKVRRVRISEAAAIAAYHTEVGFPVVEVLVSDDAPQFKLITNAHMLCWVHDGRHYKKLRPLVPVHQEQLTAFRKCYWEYYRKLYEYKQNPGSESAESLSAKFDDLFSAKTGYEELDDRIAKTRAKKENLLTVLKHPEVPLHNNRSENGARVQKRREDVSLQTKTDEGTRAKDTMMSIVETCKKLGVSAFRFIHDRVSQKFKMPTLAKLIKAKAKSEPVPTDSS